MRKEDLVDVAQLLNAIKEDIEKIKTAQKNKDAEKIAIAKKEILSFQKKISEIL